MKKFNLLAALLTIIILWSCSGSESTHDRIARDFENRRAELARPELYAVFDTTMTGDERRAMEFLYAYMPLPDMTDYTGRFYLDNVKATLKAREEMPWGNSVPEREFRHFVLPVRVNNENLDSSRMVFYAELKDRVKDLSMADAILEINHWCHEKVTYRPSDSRTSSPLASVRTAYGRCGEESTFTVAALRAMGIPARQVYTPRWAHTDDNHAWVEAWADGKWYFLGACEPEPILNLGWFNAPASRGMMMNTKVLGAYDGPEEQLDRNSCYTEINVTANYAPVAQSVVTVVDKNNTPVEGALVEFKLYNYGEFYSIARKMTDAQGKATITTGLGDMLAWASKDGQFGFAQLSATADGGTATVTIDMNADTTGTWEFDMVPPVQSASLPTPTARQIEENNKRLAAEDSIRKAYTSTFMTRADGEQVAKSTDGFATYSDRIADRLVLAEGNHAEIERFIRQHPGDTVAIGLLEAVSEKDLKDVTCDILSDHIAMPRIDNPLYVSYIVNPRIDREMLTAFRTQLRDRIKCNPDPADWIKWCADSIEIDTRWNPQWLRMSPVAVYDNRIADAVSRDIFFVAGARSLGIPARIDPVTGKPQYADSDNRWTDVDFGNTSVQENAPQGSLKLEYTQAGRLTDPQYYYHFTLSKIVDGRPVLLNYPDDSPMSKAFTPSVSLDEGQYLLTTGQRMADGTVLARATIFDIKAGETTVIPLVMRQDSTGVQVIGNFNSENIYHDTATRTDKSLLSTTGRGYYILGIIRPNHEPTTHALNDISQYKNDFEQWGGKIMLLFDDPSSAGRFNADQFGNLPSTVVYGIDNGGAMRREIVENLELGNADSPLFIIADTFNRVVYVSQGYNIGMGEQLVDVLHKINR